MRVNWSKKAIAELRAITRYIEQDSPDAAERVATHIFAEVMLLSSMPDRGKPGRVAGTREKFFLPWPYFVVFRIVRDEVRILHIRHTARLWPLRS